MNHLLRMILSRTSLILLLLLAQIVFFFLLIQYVAQFKYITTALYIISVIIVIYLITREENPAFKLSWIIPILIFPLFGGIFYVLYRRQNFSKKKLNRHHQIDEDRKTHVQDIKSYNQTKDLNYLNNISWPHYKNTKTEFLDSGEMLFHNLLADLKQAKKYIFMEFFIISKGTMWDQILDVLKQKAQEGIEIKLIYDDFGSSTLPYHYVNKLKTYGIEAIKFNPMRIHLNFAMNYRDHRKIVVIDGKIAYTGGINIGDEYINIKHPYGHWQDAGIKLEGDAVWSLIIGFLENWRFTTNQKVDYTNYKSDHKIESSGFVSPFTDTPLDQETTSKNLYLSLISQARSSILITTPYLIIDNELLTALKYAAKSGIDVNIIIPYIPDKKIIFMVTTSYVAELINSGVKVYRYKPGFIHSKMMIVDGKRAMIGTANLDFRSLYLHFENNVYLEKTDSIKAMVTFFNEKVKESILDTNTIKPNILYRLLQVLLRGFSSLM